MSDTGRQALFSASFMWEPGQYDAEFHRLNNAIEELAASLPGYRGVDRWQSSDDKRKNAIYYWDSLEALRAFSTHPTHILAKRQYERWYKGYHVVVSEVLRSYGDGSFEHLTHDARDDTPLGLE